MSDRVDEIEERWRQATPGPWDSGRGTPQGSTVLWDSVTEDRAGGDTIAYVNRGPGDAAAIAAAPDDVAWLISEVRRLGVEREAYINDIACMRRGMEYMHMLAHAEQARLRSLGAVVEQCRAELERLRWLVCEEDAEIIDGVLSSSEPEGLIV